MENTTRSRAVTSPTSSPHISPPSSSHQRSRTALVPTVHGSGSVYDSHHEHTRSLTRDFVAIAAGRPMVSLDPALHTQNLIAQRRVLRSVSPTHSPVADGEVIPEQAGAEQLQAQIDFVREFDWRMRAVRILWSMAVIAFCVIILVFSTEAECDLPLVTWLYGHTLIYILHLTAMVYNFRHFENRVRTKNFLEFLRLIFFIWWVLGQLWLYSTGPESCDQVLWYSALGLMVIEYVHLCSPCVFAATCCCWSPLSSQVERVIENHGATKKQIKNLPLVKFDTASDQDDAECTVCLTSYEKNATLRVLPCKHRFHADCIDIWLTMNKSCPLCRLDIVKPVSPKAPPTDLREPLSNDTTANFSTVAGSQGRTLTTEMNSPRSPFGIESVAGVILEERSPQAETSLERKESSVRSDDRHVEISIEPDSDT